MIILVTWEENIKKKCKGITNMKDIKKWGLSHCPEYVFKFIYERNADKQEYLDYFLTERWARKLQSLHKPNLVSQKLRVDSFMDISQGDFPYPYFNICYLNNMMANIVYALSKGKMPLINNIWDNFFEPLDIPYNCKNVEIVKCPYKYAPYRPEWSDAYSEKKISLWGTVFEQFCKYNHQTATYLENEERQILRGKENVLGVLIRGTDYTTLKPLGHPRQPSIEEVIQTISEKEKEWNIEWIYLATEEERIVKRLQAVFPNKILLNERSYYDKFFDNNKVTVIGQIKFARENDDYYKGLEYLSSLNLLSKCDYLIAGNCGGTSAAVYMNKNRYKQKIVFNKGYYTEEEYQLSNADV